MNKFYVTFEVLTAVLLRIHIFCSVMPCCWVSASQQLKTMQYLLLLGHALQEFFFDCLTPSVKVLHPFEMSIEYILSEVRANEVSQTCSLVDRFISIRSPCMRADI